MAKRLVLMPVLPNVTVSEALNLRGSGVSSSALWVKFVEGSQAAPAAHAARCRNSRRFMGTSGLPQNRRILLILDARKPLRSLPGNKWQKGAKSNQGLLPSFS